MDADFASYAWVCLPFLIAAGSGLLAAYVMQARMEVALANQREALAETRTLIATQHRAADERVKAAEEAARRKAFDELMADIRVEERQYMRESKSLLVNQRTLVLQERVYFRNIPLSDWVEHEFPMAEGDWGIPLPPRRKGAAPKPVAESDSGPQKLVEQAPTGS